MGGRDKSRLTLGNRTFLDRITSAARELNVPVETIFEDVIPDCGPLGGVLTAFKRFSFDHGLFLSCDMPLLSHEFLLDLFENYQRTRRPLFTKESGMPGFPFILPAIAKRTIQRQLLTRQYSLQALAQRLDAATFGVPESFCWQCLNVNTPADYQKALRLWSQERRSDAVLEVRNLTVRRGRTSLILGFSWKVDKGEHWVVLGANGCGKTSLFSSLVGYLTPTRGEVFVFGNEYGESDWAELRKNIGFVSSSVRQMMAETEPAWITVASGKYAMIDFWGTPKKHDKAAAMKILEAVEAQYIADRPWMYLSQGERQRVLIGRALMAKPALLILDEPCAGLDPAAREQFLAFLERLGHARSSPSVVLVTHHVEEIMPVFTHALLMKHGRKLAEGPLKQTLNSNRLSETFSTSIELRKAAGRYALRVKGKAGVIV